MKVSSNSALMVFMAILTTGVAASPIDLLAMRDFAPALAVGAEHIESSTMKRSSHREIPLLGRGEHEEIPDLRREQHEEIPDLRRGEHGEIPQLGRRKHDEIPILRRAEEIPTLG